MAPSVATAPAGGAYQADRVPAFVIRRTPSAVFPGGSFSPSRHHPTLHPIPPAPCSEREDDGFFSAKFGLFGLTAFTTEERTREIGIRKVLGASDGQIIGMLSKPLLVLIVIAAIPAIFVSYEAIDTWLERFVYHTSISALTFVIAIVVVTIVALLTVALQSRKTAQSEPVEALRYE